MSENKIKPDSSDFKTDCSARPVWISMGLYELIRKIRKERGGNISSVVEELIEKGIRCRNMAEAYNMQCRLCGLVKQDKATEVTVCEKQ